MSPQNMPIAPSASVKHTIAFKRCGSFDHAWKVRVISTHNPWRPGSHGFDLFEKVLRVKNNTTIGQIIEEAQVIGYHPSDIMRHLRWLYTWGDFLEINGKRYFPEVTKEEILIAPRRGKKS
jgi:hypothetical protein